MPGWNLGEWDFRFAARGGAKTLTWEIDLELPDEWSVIAIVGGSGSGKTDDRLPKNWRRYMAGG